MSQFTLTVHGLPTHTTAALRSMLTLLEPVLGARWRLSEETKTADVVLMPAAALARVPRDPTHDELPLLLALADDHARPPQAYASLRKPVTAPNLVEALNLAEGLINRLRGSRDGLNTVPLLEQFDSGQRLAPATLDMRVRTTLRAATFRLLQTPIAATLLDDARESLFTVLPGTGYTTRLTPTEFASVLSANPQVVLLELGAEEQQALRTARQFAPLRELEWTFWISARTPWLRPELDAMLRYRLRRWPDFGRLAHRRVDIRMASFLMAQPMTLVELQEQSGATPEEAMNLLNASFAVNALRPADPGASSVRRTVHDAPPPPKGLAAVLSQLRRKFGLARASA